MLNSNLWSEVVDPEICQGFTADEVKAALRNMNPNMAAGPDKIHPRFLHHLGPFSISLLKGIFNKSWTETIVSQECRVANNRPIPNGGKDLQKMESYGPISQTSTVEINGAPGHQPSTIFCRIDAPANRIPGRV